METGLVVQVLSTFVANPIGGSLQAALARAGIAENVGFTPQSKTREYMLAPASDTERILGTVVLLCAEDWLRDSPMSVKTVGDAWVRQELQTRMREFINEITILSYRGKPVWFLACPSTGSTAERDSWTSLCRTYTSLLVARVQNVPQVTTLNWPITLSPDSLAAQPADQSEKMPFTPDVFDRLGEFVAGQITRTLATENTLGPHTVTKRSPELAAYLAGLRVEVVLAPADSCGRDHVDRIIRTAASFSLTGEKPNLSDAEIDALLESKICMLVSVSDKLANHGPSGVVAGGYGGDTLIVHSMSLSCTVLGKQVEFAVLSGLCELASEHHCSELLFEYTPAGRNQPMLSFLQLVADQKSDTHYVLTLEQANTRINAAAVNSEAWKVTVVGVSETTRSGP
jgi:hypothetical protein